jgi:hypothetical protein
MFFKIQQICHPAWQYLNQPIGEPLNQSIWNPKQFLYLYKIQLLEKCWQKDSHSQTHF